MILISQDRLKALAMTDVKSYFIYRGGKFDKGTTPSEFGYVLMANTVWTNYTGTAQPECNQWIIGEYETLDAAIAAMQAITAIHTVGAEGRVFVERNGIRFG